MAEDKRCLRCKNFDRYYAKGSKRFNPTEYGWCLIRADHTITRDSCELFAARPTAGKKSDRPARYYLQELLTEITAIRQIMEEDSHENEEM